jgi:serine phosphatase RsbU (regulator of sigma subunit)
MPHTVNAGQTPSLVRRQGQMLDLASTAPPLGFFSQPDISMAAFQFQKMDRLLFHTDGIPETFGQEERFFGRQRLTEFLLADDSDLGRFLDHLFDRLDSFSGRTLKKDDCTAICIDFRGS